ncbi:cyclase family protein [Methylosinus sp. Sm6]|uniref:cyclase family protein n=1 Tax=Methylosinus sp. Sm6 TaxID=2866948 RepID=UPI001C991F08|nr:cyclase family protein [Methylosinus sp. Sm6]MBY6241238.1 cyclase family protein [Methylosinus sp. Sm6]
MARRPLRSLLLAALVSSTIDAPASGQSVDLSKSIIVDLTHPFDERTIYWPTSPSGFELKPLFNGLTKGGFFYAANSFCSPEHGGTHLDAPRHFAQGHWTSAEIPVERFVGPAVVIDISAKAAADRDYRLQLEDVTAFEAAHGRIAEGAIVLLRTGWSARWGDRKAYLGDDAPGDASHLHFPGFGAEAAALLAHERHVRMIGLDTASVDYGPSRDFPVHRIVAAADVSGLENLARLDELPPTGAIVFALPMKIANGTGGPARIIAIAPR